MLGRITLRRHGVVAGLGDDIAVTIGDQRGKRVAPPLPGGSGQGNAAAQQQQVELGYAGRGELSELGHG
ncbi:hypothetical protein D3C80_2085860 [compost metagenome]